MQDLTPLFSKLSPKLPHETGITILFWDAFAADPITTIVGILALLASVAGLHRQTRFNKRLINLEEETATHQEHLELAEFRNLLQRAVFAVAQQRTRAMISRTKLDMDLSRLGDQRSLVRLLGEFGSSEDCINKLMSSLDGAEHQLRACQGPLSAAISKFEQRTQELVALLKIEEILQVREKSMEVHSYLAIQTDKELETGQLEIMLSELRHAYQQSFEELKAELARLASSSQPM